MKNQEVNQEVPKPPRPQMRRGTTIVNGVVEVEADLAIRNALIQAEATRLAEEEARKEAIRAHRRWGKTAVAALHVGIAVFAAGAYMDAPRLSQTYFPDREVARQQSVAESPARVEVKMEPLPPPRPAPYPFNLSCEQRRGHDPKVTFQLMCGKTQYEQRQIATQALTGPQGLYAGYHPQSEEVRKAVADIMGPRDENGDFTAPKFDLPAAGPKGPDFLDLNRTLKAEREANAIR